MGTNALALTRRGRGAAPSSQYSHDQAFCRRPRNARPFLTFSIPSTASISPVVFSKNGLHQAATGDTAELAFGAERVEVTESLLADDYAGPRLRWALSEHRHLFSEPVPAGTNRVLVGHRTPAIMVLGSSVSGQAFPEGAALVLEPSAPAPHLLGILALAPLPGRGFHGC